MGKKQSASKSPKKPSRAGTPATSKKATTPMNEIPGCEHFWQMKFLPERGFNFAKAHHSFLSTVNNLQWERFVQTRAYYIEQIVREFYAGIQNTKGSTIFYSKVRGKKVFFDPIRINKHYDLSYNGNKFEEKLETYGKKQMAIIKDRITVEGSQWEKFTNTEFKLKTGDLVPELGNWHLFIATSILPTSHTSTLSKDRLILIDSILTEDYVDIGKLITNEIMECQTKTSGFLYFPCLITELCQKQGVVVTELEKIYRKTPPNGLSAEVKERLRTARVRNTVEPEVLEHLMQKLQAAWKFQKEQHDWLKVKLDDPDAEIESPVFPDWIIDEEEEKEEEEVVVKEKKTKRKRVTEKDKKGKKLRVEEELDEVSEEDTEEDEEARQAVKDIEENVEEDESESLEVSDSDDDDSVDMETSARRKYEVRKKAKNEAQPPSPPSQQQSNTPSPPSQTNIPSPTTHHSPSQSPIPKSPTPPPENAPQSEYPKPYAQADTTNPSQKSPTLPTEPIEPTNITVEKDKLQVLTEEAEKEEGQKDSVMGKQPQTVTEVADVLTPTVKTLKTKVLETSPEATIVEVIKALKEKKELLGYTRKQNKPIQPKKTWTMSALYGVQGQGTISGEKEKAEKETPTESKKTTEVVAKQQSEEPGQQTPMQVDVSTPEVPALATPDVPTQVTPEHAEIPEEGVEDPGVHATDVATTKPKAKKEKVQTAPTRASPRIKKKE